MNQYYHRLMDYFPNSLVKAKEEAEKDYQLAAGLTEDVEADDTILELTMAL